MNSSHMNYLYTFSSQQLSQQQFANANPITKPSPSVPDDKLKIRDLRRIKKIARYENFLNGVEINPKKVTRSKYLQMNTLMERYLSSELSTRSPFDEYPITAKQTQQTVTTQPTHQTISEGVEAGPNNMHEFTFYRKKQEEAEQSPIKRYEQDPSLKQGLNEPRNKRRALSLKMNPMMVYPISDRKLPQVFKIHQPVNSKSVDKRHKQSADKRRNQSFDKRHKQSFTQDNRIKSPENTSDFKASTIQKRQNTNISEHKFLKQPHKLSNMRTLSGILQSKLSTEKELKNKEIEIAKDQALTRGQRRIMSQAFEKKKIKEIIIFKEKEGKHSNSRLETLTNTPQ